MKLYDLIVIGGGAAGLIAGISGKGKFDQVLILEKESKVGEKLKKTGSGRCNLTNLVQAPKYYHSDKELFTVHILDNFSTRKTIQFFNELGLFTENINDYIYPYTHEAKVVVDILRDQFVDLGGVIKCQEEVIKVTKTKEYFVIQTNSWEYYSQRLLIATGSKASITTEGMSGYELANALGHTITPISPCLVPLVTKEHHLQSLAGLRHKGSVTYERDEENILHHTGELQFVADGISGIPIFQVSGDVIEDLNQGKEVTLYLNFLPDFDDESLNLFMAHRINVFKKDVDLTHFLTGLIHTKLMKVLLEFANLDLRKSVLDMNEDEMSRLKLSLSHFPIKIDGYKGLEQAQAARGGISTYEVNSITLESKLVSDLYFAGEVLAVDGLCGGYNLQWAWSSGFMAGQCLKEEDYD